MVYCWIAIIPGSLTGSDQVTVVYHFRQVYVVEDIKLLTSTSVKVNQRRCLLHLVLQQENTFSVHQSEEQNPPSSLLSSHFLSLFLSEWLEAFVFDVLVKTVRGCESSRWSGFDKSAGMENADGNGIIIWK